MNSKFKIQNSKPAKLVPALRDWFVANARDLPWRRTRDPYAIWVSEIMLQQTQVKTVIPYWERWLRELPTLKTAANASPDRIHKLWEGLGYYTRARNLQKAAQRIVEKHAGKFPDKFDDILALPGIGRYTAGAICSIAFNQPTPILDGNVIRVLTRLFGIAENPKEKSTNVRLWELAEAMVYRASRIPFQKIKSRTRTKRMDEDDTVCCFNQSLMELGALICTPRNPNCGICPAKRLCVAFRENRVEELPNLGKRVIATARRFTAFVVERNGRFLVRQRPAGVINAHLWEFPNVEIFNGNTHLKLAGGDAPGLVTSQPTPFCTVKHSITRYRITLEAFYTRIGRRSSMTLQFMEAPRARPSEGVVWKTPAQLHQLAFSSAHKKILEKLLAAPR